MYVISSAIVSPYSIAPFDDAKQTYPKKKSVRLET